MWGARQELAVAFPGSPVAGIKHPVAFAGEEIRERLFAGDRGHAIAEQDHSLLVARSGGWEEFGYDLFLEARAEHMGMVAKGGC